MKRRPDWRLQLDAVLYARVCQPFAWGMNDCALFAADAVRAITGVDLAENLRGYTSAREAYRIQREAGGLQALVQRRLGQPVPPREAIEGDVVLVPMGKRAALGVRWAESLVCGPGADGMHMTHIDKAICAWRVG